MLNVFNVIAVVRFIILVSAVGVFLSIYHKLPFRGFLTLAMGFGVSAATLALVEWGVIYATGPRYEILLLIAAVMFLVSAVLIYKAQTDFLVGEKRKIDRIRKKKEKAAFEEKVEEKAEEKAADDASQSH